MTVRTTSSPWTGARATSKSGLDAAFELDRVRTLGGAREPLAHAVQVKIAGFGGQGVLSLGIMLTQAAQIAGRVVSWYPSYGPEQRGGTSNCSVVISDHTIGSPVVYRPDVLVAMNQPSLERFVGDVKPGGLILYDATIGTIAAPPGVRAEPVPALQLATEGGSARAANTVMFGVLMALGVTAVPAEAFRLAVEESFADKPKLVPLNLDVLDRAARWAAANL